MLEDILLQVNKPARYTAGEWNSPKKDFEKACIKFALSFPDLYEVGMSNLGLRILYGILNNIPDVCCERVFPCDCDMENILRNKRMEIFSLESRRRLREFDIIGFSLGSELNYTNLLNILDLGGLPLEASLRDHNYPLVIGGGPCALNPEPLHEFFDLFVIGEAEDLILELVDTYRRYKEKFKAGKISKEDLLFIFSQLEGVYAPSLYEATYNTTGAPEEFRAKVKGAPPKIKKRFVADLNSCFFPLEWLLPYIQIVHDRLTMEIMRGCPNSCRFCQARSQYFPLRLRDIKDILTLSSAVYKCTGYEEISLGGLSVSDYPGIEELLKGMTDLFRDKAVGISLPSIKPSAMVGGLSSLIAGTRKTGLTFAPEAGSERLRKIIAKDFDEGNLFRALEQAYLAGYQHVKLYFMIGLPQEEEKDLGAIIDLSTRVSEARRKLTGMPGQVNISINTLIPKPHTPLQWLGMEDTESIKYKQDYLKNNIRNRRLKLGFHNRYMSFLEGVLSRGDRRLSRVISCAFKKGARFDAWGQRFSFEKWRAAFEETGIDPLFYLKEKKEDGLLPWDFVDVGIKKETLAEEFKKVIAI
jgi:radical SAM family uncharacterized protein